MHAKYKDEQRLIIMSYIKCLTFHFCTWKLGRKKKKVHGVKGKLHIIDTKFSVYIKILENICNPIIGFLKY